MPLPQAGRARAVVVAGALLLACAVVSPLPRGAAAEQASEPASLAAGALDAGGFHTCAVLVAGSLRCWGFGMDGQLGYGNANTVGDDETPGSLGPVNFGAEGRVKAIAAGDFHTCALLDAGSVRCWGFGGDGRLGYGNTSSIADPGSVGPVDLGSGRTAKAITAGAAHTCAVLDDGTVRCWGYGGGGLPRDGRLGYGDTKNIGDDETPGSVAPVKVGGKAVAISAGAVHTCALLDDGSVRCWGRNNSGQLGYGNTYYVGGNPSESGDTQYPDMAGPVKLGVGGKAVAISAGGAHTCVLLDGGGVRCWGGGGAGQLGYGNRDNIGDTETPDSVGTVSLGPGGTATAISAGDAHTCARLGDGSVRCWGLGASGRLGYGNQSNIGDNEKPDSVGPVDLGSGHMATAVSAGKAHTCARLDDGSVRCWGLGANGRLGYCNEKSIGDDETPGSAGPVDLGESGGGGAGCARPPGGGLASAGTAPAADAIPTSGGKKVGPPVASDAARARALRTCLARVASHAKRESHLARRGSARRRARARRHLSRHATTGRRRCLHLHGRTPGRVIGLRARSLSQSQIELSFNAAGTDGDHPPAAHSYLIRQSRRPIRNARDFTRAETLCEGSCHFEVTKVGGRVSLRVIELRPHTTYYYALAARDNVSGRCGPRSKTVKARTAKAGRVVLPPDQGHGHEDPMPPRLRNRRGGSCRALR